MANHTNGVSLSGEQMPKGKRIRGQTSRARNGQEKGAPSDGPAIVGVPAKATDPMPAVAPNRIRGRHPIASNGQGHGAPSDGEASNCVPDKAGFNVPAVAQSRNGSHELRARKSPIRSAPGGEEAIYEVPTTAMAAVPLAAPLFKIVEEIVDLQFGRRFCIKSQSRCDRSCEAFIARSLGFRTDLDEKARKKLFDQAAEIRKAVEKGDGEGHVDHADGQSRDAITIARPIIALSAQSRKVWDDQRVKTEGRMRELARLTPGWGFAQSIKGFSDLGLAVIIGEAGLGTKEKPSLANYPRVDHLWKRMGLAVFDGNRQGNPGKGASAEEWKRHGYRPPRRAEMWAFFSDVMFRHQWRGEKDGEPAHPIGPYGEIYARRRAHTADREGWSKGHSHNDARRIMTKALLEDLWKFWRAAVIMVPEKAAKAMPPAKGRSAKGRDSSAGKPAGASVPEAERPAA